jgi:hypothetical protein
VKNEEEIHNAVKTLQDMAWAGEDTQAEFTRQITHGHRTNQQRIVRLAYKILMAVNDYPYMDDRNKSAKMFCKAVADLGEQRFPMI